MKRVRLLVDPRFSGGTSSAVAQEIPVLSQIDNVKTDVVWMETAHFKGRNINEKLTRALDASGVPSGWGDLKRKLHAHAFVLHNPAALKFDRDPPFQIFCDRLLVICHENFLRPDGGEGFAVAHVLEILRRAGYARKRILVPISDWNRQTVNDWLAKNPQEARHWCVADEDWFNICEFDMKAPTAAPMDRRGRVSRPGFEKFPTIKDLEACFPPEARVNRILGGDSLLIEEGLPENWDVIPFGGEKIERFFSSIDFFVYFTNPRWRESFGRVIAEAIAEGKLVMTDPQTARIFGKGVVACHPGDVSRLIEGFVSDPAKYRRQVLRAQKDLRRFNRDAFLNQAQKNLFNTESIDASL